MSAMTGPVIVADLIQQEGNVIPFYVAERTVAPSGENIFLEDALNFRLATQPLMLDMAAQKIFGHLLEAAVIDLRLLRIELAEPSPWLP